MACRFAAEKGLDLGTQKKLARCIDEGAAITKKQVIKILINRLGGVRTIDFIWRLQPPAGSPFLKTQVEQIISIPLAIAYVVADWGGLINAENIGRAQVDHINIMDALMRGQATRAELRMREHLENTVCLIFDTITGRKN